MEREKGGRVEERCGMQEEEIVMAGRREKEKGKEGRVNERKKGIAPGRLPPDTQKISKFITILQLCTCQSQKTFWYFAPYK